jgi:cytochrome c-type biogenesis protein CcmH/NrfG
MVLFSVKKECRMKTIVRMIVPAFAAAICLSAQGWAQNADELEEAGLRHFEKAYYEAVPKKEDAVAAEEFRKAEASFRQAIRNRPERVQPYLHLGRTLFVQGKYLEAAKVYGDALKIEPENKPVYLQLASAQEQAGDYGAAVATLQMLRAKESDPGALDKLDDLIGRLKARQPASGPQESTSSKGGSK